MNNLRPRCLPVVAVAAAVLGGSVAAQEPADPNSAAEWSLQEMRERAAEFVADQTRLHDLLNRVFVENSGLEEELEALEAAYVDAMVALDPETAERRARLRGLEDAYTSAVLADDTTAVRTLVDEGVELLHELEATADEAAGQPDLAREIEAFRTTVVARLTAIDPDAPRLLERHDAVAALIKTTVLGLQ